MMSRFLIVLGLAALMSSCGGGSTRPARREARSVSDVARLPPGSRVLLDETQPLSGAYDAGGSLYYADTSPVGEHTGETYRLTRVDTASGRVTATHRFLSAVDSTLLAGGSLWVTTTAGDLTSLWRLNPRSLTVRSKTALPSAGHTEEITGSLAAAGGGLWVGNGTLDRVSLSSGRVDRVVRPSHPGPVQLVADQTGEILLASLGYEHPTYIARIDPRTGATISEITIPRSASQPTIGGVIDGGAWIENTIAAKTIAWRINVNTLKVTTIGARPNTVDRISVRVLGGVLWITRPRSQSNLNYCANPVTGRPLARLPPLPGDSVLLTADATSIFYTDVPVNAHSVKLETAPISPDCAS